MADPFPLDPNQVLAAVAAAYNLDPAILANGNGHRRPVGEARALAYRLLYDEARLSWVEVSKRMGLRPGGASSVAQKARNVDPLALAALRFRLYPNGSQQSFEL